LAENSGFPCPLAMKHGWKIYQISFDDFPMIFPACQHWVLPAITMIASATNMKKQRQDQ